MVVTPTGAHVTVGDGASIDIPAGALQSNTTITGTTTDATAPADTVMVGTPYLFGPEGTQFAQPVTIVLAFDPSKLPAGRSASDVAIYTAPAGSSNYQALPTTLVDGSHVQATTTHFSIFVAAVVTPLFDLGVNEGADASVHEADAAVGGPDASVGGGSDASVGGSDASAGGSDASAGGSDASGGNGDMGCVRTLTVTGQLSCQITATCGGHQYKVDCPSSSVCVCYVDGVGGSMLGNVGGSCSTSINHQTGSPAWNVCGFP
jgi:hypothetical protein